MLKLYQFSWTKVVKLLLIYFSLPILWDTLYPNSPNKSSKGFLKILLFNIHASPSVGGGGEEFVGKTEL